MQANALKVQANALKVQVDASKVQVDALKVQADASKVQADALKVQGDASKVQLGREGERFKVSLAHRFYRLGDNHIRQTIARVLPKRQPIILSK
ncbi:hypothetical protein NIES2100_13470 [Calothrix sp. NIES-2100]|nr:hypothetical protein NIES2100_13470 [Calothrix sp. NIES-2100]